MDSKLKSQPGQGEKSFAAQLWQQSTTNLYGASPRCVLPFPHAHQNIPRTLSTGHHNAEKSRETVVILNNIDQSITNTYTLKNQLEEEMEAMFKDVREKDKFQVRSRLEMLLEISKSFERIVERGVQRFSQSFHRYLSSSLEKFRTFNYQITEQQFLSGRFDQNTDIRALGSAAVGAMSGDSAGKRAFSSYPSVLFCACGV